MNIHRKYKNTTNKSYNYINIQRYKKYKKHTKIQIIQKNTIIQKDTKK